MGHSEGWSRRADQALAPAHPTASPLCAGYADCPNPSEARPRGSALACGADPTIGITRTDVPSPANDRAYAAIPAWADDSAECPS